MSYRLIATDLDGTLLNREGRISPENRKAIEEMVRRGVHFVPASGRCFMELPTELQESEFIRYYILSGGATVYDKKTDRYEMTCPEKSVMKWVLDTIFQFSVCLFAHTGKASYVDAAQHNPDSLASYNMSPYWVKYALVKEKPMENLKEHLYSLDKIPMLVAFFSNLDDLKVCKDILSQEKEILVVQSDPCNLEVVSRKAGKGNALLYLADSIGLSREETIAVGDSYNDKTMLEVAGLSLAMENAMPEMKMISDEVICDNDSHCAKYVLDHYLT